MKLTLLFQFSFWKMVNFSYLTVFLSWANNFFLFLVQTNTNFLIAFQECQISLTPFYQLLQSRYLGNISLFRNARITHFFDLDNEHAMLYRVTQRKVFQKWHFCFGSLVLFVQCTYSRTGKTFSHYYKQGHMKHDIHDYTLQTKVSWYWVLLLGLLGIHYKIFMPTYQGYL